MKKTFLRLVRFCAILVLVAGIYSCGYQLVQEKGIYGGDITSLYLPVFKNVTYEPHASLYATDAFSRELTGSGLFVMNKDGADAYLEGTIRRIYIIPSSMDKNGVVVEKQATMDIDLSLYKKGGVFVKKWSLTDFEVYRVDDINAEDYNKRNALRIISGRMARKFSAAVLIDY